VVKQLAKELLIDSTSVLVREAAKAALWKLANGGNGGAVCDNPEAHRVIYTLMEVREESLYYSPCDIHTNGGTSKSLKEEERMYKPILVCSVMGGTSKSHYTIQC
jgi:hypothetical protein